MRPLRALGGGNPQGGVRPLEESAQVPSHQGTQYDDKKFVKELLDACSNKKGKYHFEDYVVEKGRGLETSLTSLANVVGQSTSVRLPTWGQAHLRIHLGFQHELYQQNWLNSMRFPAYSSGLSS